MEHKEQVSGLPEITGGLTINADSLAKETGIGQIMLTTELNRRDLPGSVIADEVGLDDCNFSMNIEVDEKNKNERHVSISIKYPTKQGTPWGPSWGIGKIVGDKIIFSNFFDPALTQEQKFAIVDKISQGLRKTNLEIGSDVL